VNTAQHIIGGGDLIMADKKVLLFGGTGRTGLEITHLLQAHDDHVIVVARDDSNTVDVEAAGATIVRGDVFDPEALTAAATSAPCDLAICTIGNRPGADRKVDFDGVRNVVDSCVAAGITRFVLITSIGCGNSRSALSEQTLKFLGPMCERKTQGEDYLCATDLNWTIIRPGGLSSDPPSGNAILSEDPLTSGEVNRSDVARFTIECLDNPESAGKIYSAVDPNIRVPGQP